MIEGEESRKTKKTLAFFRHKCYHRYDNKIRLDSESGHTSTLTFMSSVLVRYSLKYERVTTLAPVEKGRWCEDDKEGKL